VLGLAGGATTLLLFEYHLRAARVASEKGHNADAIPHLDWCARIKPDHREVLLLSARGARRAGAFEAADIFLRRYTQLCGDEEAVVLERLLYRMTRGEIETVGPILRLKLAEGGAQARLIREAIVAGLIDRFRWKEARGFLEEWLAEAPDDTLALLSRG